MGLKFIPCLVKVPGKAWIRLQIKFIFLIACLWHKNGVELAILLDELWKYSCTVGSPLGSIHVLLHNLLELWYTKVVTIHRGRSGRWYGPRSDPSSANSTPFFKWSAFEKSNNPDELTLKFFKLLWTAYWMLNSTVCNNCCHLHMHSLTWKPLVRRQQNYNGQSLYTLEQDTYSFFKAQ